MLNMWTLWQDLRYSARLLGKHPGFTLTAVGVLTLGIGVNAGVFGIINGLMIGRSPGPMRRVRSSACSARTVRPRATIAPSPIRA
jgi:macrolide transport system ATP-binding/permease protein